MNAVSALLAGVWPPGNLCIFLGLLMSLSFTSALVLCPSLLWCFGKALCPTCWCQKKARRETPGCLPTQSLVSFVDDFHLSSGPVFPQHLLHLPSARNELIQLPSLILSGISKWRGLPGSLFPFPLGTGGGPSLLWRRTNVLIYSAP